MRPRFLRRLLLVAALAASVSGCGGTDRTRTDRTRIVVATVANPQMKDVQELARVFERENPDIAVKFVTLPENQLRDRVEQGIAAGGGEFDVATIGTYEVPIWAGRGWIEPLDRRIAGTPGYDGEDLLPAIRRALTARGRDYAIGFYGESSMLMYRKDLFHRAGLTMPAQPTWHAVARLARRLDDRAHGRAGICLRGLPGWGEMLAPLTTVVNTFGGRWYDQRWRASLTEAPFRRAVRFYVDLLRDAGEPGAERYGYTECLEAFGQGRAAMWYDATAAAGSLEDAGSRVAGKVGYAPAPVERTRASGWLWAWSLAIPTSSRKQDAAWRFIAWATSKPYQRLVGERLGWSRVPPGSRESTYRLPQYRAASKAFGGLTLRSIGRADVERPGLRPVPYTGIQYVAIPEFQALGTAVSREISLAIAGRQDVDTALRKAQALAQDAADQGGYRR